MSGVFLFLTTISVRIFLFLFWVFVHLVIMRYKEYSRNQVLEKSILLFWNKGVKGCSINDIVEDTGVNRFSLYHEFENKQGILDASLQLYRARYAEEKMKILKGEGDVANTILNFFMSFLEAKRPVAGCYMIHVGTELADSDAKVKKEMVAYLRDIESLFVELLLRNNFTQDHAKFTAKHLLGLFCTAMSFCLIHNQAEQKVYLLKGIHLILSKHG